jgi:Domain of unknown function (DUF4116)
MSSRIHEKNLVYTCQFLETIPVLCTVSAVAIVILKTLYSQTIFNENRLLVAYALDTSLSRTLLALLGFPISKVHKEGLRETLVMAHLSKESNENKLYSVYRKRLRHDLYQPHLELLKQDSNILLSVLKYEPCLLVSIKRHKQLDIHFIKNLIKKQPRSLWYLDPLHKANKELVIEAIKLDGMAILDVGPEYLHDKEIILLALKTYPEVYTRLPHELKTDHDIAHAVLEKSPNLYEHLDNSLKLDRAFKMKALRNSGLLLKYLPLIDQNDALFVQEACKQNGFALEYASERLRSCYKTVMTALRQNNQSLKHASMSFQSLYEIFLDLCQREEKEPYLYKIRLSFELTLYHL